MTQAKTVRVDLGSRSYDIVIGAGLIPDICAKLGPILTRRRVFVLSDETVWALHGARLCAPLEAEGLEVYVRCVPAGEASKNWTELTGALDWLLTAEAGRDDTLLAFGGGVVGDLAGLTAAMLKRGMPFVQIPTTLLAQVDSSVGGKTAINTRQGKNLIGAFYQPRLVVADLDILDTLAHRDVLAGYAEILKYGFIDDPNFLNWLETNGEAVVRLERAELAEAVATSCRAKARIVAQDEQESGLRALLNLGHTFGHAVEKLNGYGADVLHGEAVGMGMALALQYSARLGLISADEASRGCGLISKSGLQTALGCMPGGPYTAAALTKAMRQDKKARANNLPLILVKGLGHAFMHSEADMADVEAFLHEHLMQTPQMEISG